MVGDRLRILVVTSEWPTRERPRSGAFIVDMVRSLGDAGVDVDVFSFMGARRPWRYLRAWADLQRRIGAGGYDLVHAQWGHSGFLASFPKRLPLVVTYRGGDLHGIAGRPFAERLVGHAMRTISRVSARRADATIVVAPGLRRFLPKPPSAVIPSGVDLDCFRPLPRGQARRRLALPPDGPLVLFCGTRQPGKRMWLAEEAARLAGARLIAVCDAPREQVRLYMSACDVLILTSTTEGSPNVVKEALACNLPVVSVDVGDVRERIGGVEGCEFCPDDRPETLAAALRRALDRGTRVHGRRAVQDLNLPVVAGQIVDVYRRTLEVAGPKGRRQPFAAAARRSR